MSEGLVGHHWTEIRTTDADVDDIFDALACVAFPLATTDAVGKYGHAVEDFVNFGNDVYAINLDRGCARRTESGVQDGAILGDVDFIASEHRVDPIAKTGGIGEFDKGFHRFLGDQVFRVIEKEPSGFDLEFLRALRICVEEFREVREGFSLIGERVPSGV